jgi:cation:H+ antiporter
MTAWLILFGSAVVIVYAGAKLSRYGDEIAELTGLGRLWIGVVLMAAATSLPELFTTVSAAWMDVPDLAAGDLFGAGMANMLTLALIDQLHRGKRVWQQAAFEHALVAALAMILTALAAFFILYGPEVEHGRIGWVSLLLPTLYVLGMRVVYRQELLKRREQAQDLVVEARAGEEPRRGGARTALRRAGVRFAFAALALLLTAPLLAASADQIAKQTGVSESFIGTSLVAITTSLPELITSLAAVRLGAFDLAVGNLFGSNAFNMAAFMVVDLAYRRGPLFGDLDGAHALTALWSIVLMSTALMGIIYRVEKRVALIDPDSLAVILGYLFGLWLLFH